MTTYAHSKVQQAIGSTPAQYDAWVKILGSEAEERKLTRVEAIAIAAVEHMRQRGVPRKKLERTFARLAFQPPAGTDWLLVSESRKGIQVVEAPFTRDLRSRQQFKGHMFDPAVFLRDLDA